MKNQRKKEEDLLKNLLDEYCKNYDNFTTVERKIILNCFYLTNMTIDDIIVYRDKYLEGKLNVKTT